MSSHASQPFRSTRHALSEKSRRLLASPYISVIVVIICLLLALSPPLSLSFSLSSVHPSVCVFVRATKAT